MKKIKILRQKIKKIKPSKSIIGLLFASLIIISPIIGNKIIYGHDYMFHATNMLLTSRNLNFLNLNLMLPKIFGGEIAFGFGYGTGIFYPPLSYNLAAYIAKLFNLTKENIFLSITIVQILIILLSGITMYLSINKIFKNKKIAGLGSISYISSTYFLCNIYTRSAIAESLTFIFIPLVFLGLYELFYGDKIKFYIFFTIGYIGMISSHLVLSVYLTFIIIIIFLFFIKYILKKEILKNLILSSILILLITSPYLVPLLEHKIKGEYVVFETNGMYLESEIKDNTIKLDEFINKNSNINDVRVYINHVVLISSIITIIFNKEIFKKEHKKVYITSMIIIIVTTILSSSFFPWENMPSFLKMIQFPWRLRGLMAFALAILAGNSIALLKGNNQNFIIVVLALSTVLFAYNNLDRSNIDKVSNLTELNMGVEKEYLPTKTLVNYKYAFLREKDISIIKGNGKSKIIKNETPYLKAKIELETDKITIELPRLYYIGYDIKLKNQKNQTEKIKYYENQYGFIELELEESGTLEVSYKGSSDSKIAKYISILTIFGCILIMLSKKTQKLRV